MVKLVTTIISVTVFLIIYISLIALLNWNIWQERDTKFNPHVWNSVGFMF